MISNSLVLSRILTSAALIVFGLIYFADLITPLALALFLWLTIDGMAVALHKRFPLIERKYAVPLTLFIVFLLLTFMVAFIADYGVGFSKDLDAYHIRLDETIAGFYKTFNIAGTAPTVGDLFERISPVKILSGVSDVLKGFSSQALFVFIYVISLFAAQASLPKKIVNIFPNSTERRAFTRITGAIRKSMEQYLWVQTITGLMISVLCWILFLIFGLKNALFWAMITFLLSYIPAVGGLVASVLPALFALVQFVSPIPALGILVISQIIQFIIGNIVQPRMTGDSLNISVLMVFLSLAFWGKIWGGTGMFLAVPISVMIMIIMAQFPTLRPIAILMSANGNPDRHDDKDE